MKQALNAIFAAAIAAGVFLPATHVPLHGQSGDAIQTLAEDATATGQDAHSVPTTSFDGPRP